MILFVHCFFVGFCRTCFEHGQSVFIPSLCEVRISCVAAETANKYRPKTKLFTPLQNSGMHQSIREHNSTKHSSHLESLGKPPFKLSFCSPFPPSHSHTHTHTHAHTHPVKFLNSISAVFAAYFQLYFVRFANQPLAHWLVLVPHFPKNDISQNPRRRYEGTFRWRGSPATPYRSEWINRWVRSSMNPQMNVFFFNCCSTRFLLLHSKESHSTLLRFTSRKKNRHRFTVGLSTIH